MSFYGSSFSFDGISCEEYGLMLYDFNTTSQGNSEFAKGMEIQEDRIPGRTRSLFYGTYYKQSLEFTLVFGANEYAANMGEDIDRQEMEVIGSWLTGHLEYKPLVIDQQDMDSIVYMCILTDLKVLEYAGNKWAFQCSVHCDSPFARTLPQVFSYTVDGTSEVTLHSRSTSNLPYYPVVQIALNGNGSFSIENQSNENYTFSITNVPQTSDTIYLNGETGVVKAESGLNMYPYINFKFPRLVRGANKLVLTGNGTVTFTCEFPVNVGG